MAATCVLFVQGGGEGAHAADAALADSLASALGAGYELRYPQMPGEADPDAAAWTWKIGSELARAGAETILVGHSLGGAMVLRYLAENAVERSISSLFLLAAPSWDEDRWNFDDLKLPDHLGERLSGIPRIFLYQCRDDEVVPFAHLALHRARIPRAVVRAFASGGHQFGGDLIELARDIHCGR